LQPSHSPPELPDPPHAHFRCSVPNGAGVNDRAGAAVGFIGV